VGPLEESLRLFRGLGDQTRLSVVTFNLVWAYNELGDRERARALAEDSLRRARSGGNERTLSFALDSLETYAREEGRLDEALSMNREILRIRWGAGDRLHVADSLGRFAAVFAGLKRTRPAVQLLARSDSAFQELGISTPAYWETRRNETLAALRSQLDEGAFAEAWDEGLKMTLDEAVALALNTPD
jgi:tetratricopeptide (TPR) repeat protein